jgi:broad specificity phosphatase PhoE
MICSGLLDHMRIYLIRHGESANDVERCFGGIADFALTERGRQSAHALAVKLEHRDIEILYSSPYRRAKETAEILSSLSGAHIKVLGSLAERNCFGVLSGVNRERAAEIFGHIVATLKDKPGDFYSAELVPGAEPMADFIARVCEAFHYIIRDAKGHDAIGIVTHSNVKRAIYHQMFAVSGRVAIEHLAVTVLNVTPEGVTIEESTGVYVT